MWPFSEKRTPFNTWPILRTKPEGKKYGRAIQLFINNWQCHLTTVNVFSDGAIDCWGFVDLELFKQKLRARWVVPSPTKDDQQISVFHFGMTGFRNAEWLQTTASIAAEVDAIVESLNPERKDLLDMHGSDIETRGKGRFAKMGWPDKKPYRLAADSSAELLGESVSILRVQAGTFELTNLFLFSDGLIKIGAETTLLPLAQLKHLYERGEIASSAPAGSRIMIPGIGSFETTTDFGYVSQEDRICELADILDQLQGKPGAVALCREAFTEFQNAPSVEKKEVLKQIYEKVPRHLRCYCGDMDSKDSAIRKELYG